MTSSTIPQCARDQSHDLIKLLNQQFGTNTFIQISFHGIPEVIESAR
jgi:hypothetical protein